VNPFENLARVMERRPGDALEPIRVRKPKTVKKREIQRIAEQPNHWGLSGTQCEVLRLMVAGHSVKSVAKMLSISIKTVAEHVRRLKERMEVDSLMQAAIKWDRQFREQPREAGSAEVKAGRCYIAGPMTGIENLNFPAFHKAAASLRASGHEVVNPAEIVTDPTAKWEDCMRADLAQMLGCTHIALLPNWDKSRGAQLEAHIAHALGMRPIYLTTEGV